MFSSREIQNQVKSGYIDRVGTRLKKMRKQLMDRDWNGLKSEAGHLAEGAENFGYRDVAEEVQKTLTVLNTRSLSRTTIDTEVKVAMEHLFRKLDRFLVEELDR